MAARHYRFGKPTTEGPISGRRVIVIPEIDHLVLIDKRIQKSSLEKVSLITKERQKMRLSITLIWKPTDAAKTIENIKPDDIEPTFFKIVESVIKNECTKMTVEEILENSTLLEKNIKKILYTVTESWGITVTSTNISNIVVNNVDFMQNMALPKEIELEKAAKLAQLEEEQTIALKTIEKDKVSQIAELESERLVEAKKEQVLTEIKEIQCRRESLIEGLKRKSIQIAAQNQILKEKATIIIEAQKIKSAIIAETEGLKEKLNVINTFSSSAIKYELVKILPELYKNIDLGNITLFESSGTNGEGNGNGFNFLSSVVGSAYSIMDKVDNVKKRNENQRQEIYPLAEIED
jgi:regulator of protease activity HflC (stomatin/prohibitin superfamily)